MFDEATKQDVERLLLGGALQWARPTWPDLSPNAPDPLALLGEEIVVVADGTLVRTPLTMAQKVEGTGEDRHITYPCPYCHGLHTAKVNRTVGGHYVAPCCGGAIACLGPDGLD